MAQSIKGDAASPKKKRGRPTKAEIEARKAGEAAAQAQADGKTPAGDSAPAFGHNRATEGLFLHHVGAILKQNDAIDLAKALVKTERGKLKDIRMLAKADGIVLGELDEALEALETERVDLLAREERRVLYFEWLGLPTLRSADSTKIEKDAASRWFHMGNIAGRLGKIREIPDGCPVEHGQDWLKGHEKGQEALMREAPLTRDGFKDDTAGTAAAAAPEPPAGAPSVDAGANVTNLLILKEEDFATGTSLDDCNLKTLVPARAEAWGAAERVVVVLGSKKRVLKEPGYEDTGEPTAEISEPETAEAELLAQAGAVVTGAAPDEVVAEEPATGADTDAGEVFH